jgi:hypothetical protein
MKCKQLVSWYRRGNVRHSGTSSQRVAPSEPDHVAAQAILQGSLPRQRGNWRRQVAPVNAVGEPGTPVISWAWPNVIGTKRKQAGSEQLLRSDPA